MHTKYYIGFDLGSSSVKVALVDASTGENILSLHEPKHEMSILSKQSDWAEQDPNNWWKFVCQGTKRILQESKIDHSKIEAVGISYQEISIEFMQNTSKQYDASITPFKQNHQLFALVLNPLLKLDELLL